jgi:predicted phosphodiesterase
MTTWSFISDVHGNLPLLERAIQVSRARGAEQFVCLGDSLGRGDSDACVRLIAETVSLSVVGNRDLDWAERVNPATRQYVLGLPRLAEAADFVAVHGDARLLREPSSDDLRTGFRRAYAWLRQRERRLLFFGHTHQARVWRKEGLHAPPTPIVGPRVALPHRPETVYLVNVGTTGLPFPGKGPPSCVLYDDRAGWVEHLVLGPPRGKAPVGTSDRTAANG